MRFEELNEALALARLRGELLQEADEVEERGADASHLFGVQFDLEMEDVLRMAMAGELRRRAGLGDARLRELGVVFPGDAIPDVEPVAPGHASIRPGSWNADAGVFTVWLPCAPAKALRYVDGAFVEVDEALSPHGLMEGIGAPVFDVTNASHVTMASWQCGSVVGIETSHEGIELRVRIDGYHGLVRAAVGDGRILDVGIGYDRLDEDVVQTQGDRPLVNVHRWHLKEIRLLRRSILDEAA